VGVGVGVYVCVCMRVYICAHVCSYMSMRACACVKLDVEFKLAYFYGITKLLAYMCACAQILILSPADPYKHA
jgi:hypothetical protein